MAIFTQLGIFCKLHSINATGVTVLAETYPCGPFNVPVVPIKYVFALGGISCGQ